MSWSVETTAHFDKSFKKLNNYTKHMIKGWIEKHLMNGTDLRSYGKVLVGNLKGYWRYRIGDYRLICEIQDQKLVILAVGIGHRRDVYQ